MTKRSCRCSRCTDIFVIMAVIILIIICGVVLASIFVKSGQFNNQRFCTTATAGLAIGTVEFDIGAVKIRWDQQYLNLTSIPTNINIHGPIQPGFVSAPVAVVLCGVPSSLACDTSVAGVLKGEIGETYTGGALPPVIKAITCSPHLYYLAIGTAMEEITAPFNSYCGIAL